MVVPCSQGGDVRVEVAVKSIHYFFSESKNGKNKASAEKRCRDSRLSLSTLSLLERHQEARKMARRPEGLDDGSVCRV